MRNRLVLAVVSILAASTAAAIATTAAARTTGKQRFTLSGTTVKGKDSPIKVLAAGPIHGTGTASFVDHGKWSKATLRLPRGQVFVIYTGKRFILHLNPHSCTATIEYDGTFTIIGGTRHFRTASGSGTFTEHRHLIGQRDHAGTCLGQHAPPAKTTAVNIARGTATLAAS